MGVCRRCGSLPGGCEKNGLLRCAPRRHTCTCSPRFSLEPRCLVALAARAGLIQFQPRVRRFVPATSHSVELWYDGSRDGHRDYWGFSPEVSRPSSAWCKCLGSEVAHALNRGTRETQAQKTTIPSHDSHPCHGRRDQARRGTQSRGCKENMHLGSLQREPVRGGSAENAAVCSICRVCRSLDRWLAEHRRV